MKVSMLWGYLRFRYCENKFDIIYLNGIYQYIEKPALALWKFIKSLKKMV